MQRLREDGRDLTERVKWLMILRVVVVTVMLGFTVLLQLKEGTAFFSTPLRNLYLFIGIFYFLTIAYSVAVHRGMDNSALARFQISVDLLLISGIVLITGGVESLFSITYFLAIIGAGILFYRRGSLVTAGASALLYAAAVWAPFFPAVARIVDYEHTYLALSYTYVAYRIVLTAFGFVLVAALSSYLTESLRRAGEELTATSSHLAELERRSENILHNISSGLITTDLSGRTTYINRAAKKIGKIDEEDALGQHLLKIMQFKGDWDPFDNIPAFHETPYRVEGWMRGRSEEQFLGSTFSLLRDEGEHIAGVICSFQDLSRIRKMEEQMRRSDRLAVVGELSAGMAHEIRNPLASLSGSIQLLAEELVLEDTSRELMDIINREVTRLNAIITDFLRFASPRALQVKVVDLLEILRETATLLQQAPHHACEIKVQAEGEGDFRAEVDPTMMKQVFWNFSRNAIEAMPQGGALTLSMEKVSVELEGGDILEHLKATFSDTGVGISAAELEKVFTPFHSTKEHGTGLGLAIVFKIIEAHRGRIEVKSQVGKGTTFAIHLPVRQVVSTLAPLAAGDLP